MAYRRASMAYRPPRRRHDASTASRKKDAASNLRGHRGVRHHVEHVAHLPLRPRGQRLRVQRVQSQRRDRGEHEPGHNIKRRQERHSPVVYEVARRASKSSCLRTEAAQRIYVGRVMSQRLQQLLQGCIVRIAPSVIVGAAWRYLGSTAWLPEHCVCKGCLFSSTQRLATRVTRII